MLLRWRLLVVGRVVLMGWHTIRGNWVRGLSLIW
jgi:hypothetical protein